MAIVVSSTMELISAVTRMRARTLEQGVARLLDDQRRTPAGKLRWVGIRKASEEAPWTKAVMKHPLIVALSSARATDRPPSYVDAVTFATALLGSSVETPALIAKFLEDRKALDAQIAALPKVEPGSTVIAAWQKAEGDPTKLINTLLADKVHGTAGIALLIGPSLEARIAQLTATGVPAAVPIDAAWTASKPDVEKFVTALQQQPELITQAVAGAQAVTDGIAQIKASNPHLGTSLESLWVRAGSDFKAFRREIEDWFDREMERVSGWYARWTKWIMIVVGLAIAAALNVSAVTVGRALWLDPTLRSAAEAVAEQQAAESSPTTTAAASPTTTIATSSTSPPTTTAATATVPKIGVDTLKRTGMPMGWNRAAWPGWTGYLALHLFGIVLVAIAASFGAPFWFDLLNRLVNLRATGKPPPVATDQRKKDTT